MRVSVQRADCTEFETPLLVVKLFEGEEELVGPIAKIDERLGGQISRLRRRGDFRGKEGEVLPLYPAEGTLPAERLVLVGLGKREELDLERLRRAAGTAVKQAQKLRVQRLSSIMHHAELVEERITPGDAARAVTEGVILGAYSFDELKTKQEDQPPPLEEFIVLEKVEEKARQIEEGVRIGDAIARAQNLARTLGNLPGNVATPTYLADTARRIAGERGMQVTVLGRDAMREEGLHAHLAVSQGSDQEPQFIILEHRGGAKGEKPLVLIGKGLTFDAGGISIKPAERMEEMKFDMCGGAAVLAAMQAIGELGVKANVIGVVPASENLISGAAVKPGDIIGSHLGKSIEVINTDAEGRLLLADALSYVRRFEPAAVLDAATLTGAIVIALGNQATGLMSNDEGLTEELRRIGDRVGERVWPMPMYKEYKEQLKTEYADIKNTGGRAASSITAGWFLREFVGDFPWAHLDIAGTAWGDGKLAYQTKGATGTPVRLFVEWVLSRAS
ncbi:MAG: leucyl aminopeptidase [Gemmatimonadetes bacterium]|nr:leucyl aminopeptidase [Gemmatimonadota bacterium]